MLTDTEKDQELRVRCLSLAAAGCFTPTSELIERAQALYDFATGTKKPGDEAKMKAA